MKITDVDFTLEAFQQLCEEVEANGLLDSQDCQYWIFEKGYQAAMQKIAADNKIGNLTSQFSQPNPT